MPKLDMVKNIHEDIKELRIERQFQALCDWDDGKITGREAIRKIVEEEQIIYYPSNPIFVDYIERKRREQQQQKK